MKVKLTHLGKAFIPMESIDMKYWKNVKNVHDGKAVFEMYQVEEPHGFTMTHYDQDVVPDGEYDLPLTIADFAPEDVGVNTLEERIYIGGQLA